jgi:hypothetical protein
MSGTTYDHEVTMTYIIASFRNFAMMSLLVTDEDAKMAREAVATAEAIGFVLDSTAYRTALQTGRLERQRKIVTLFEKTKCELKELFPVGWPE